uniref:BZIP domain-containing protein n=1 Tax=Aegilops tauschii subsp. strangulata TaxID=200361 RepID=A0A453NMI5_AEGTS
MAELDQALFLYINSQDQQSVQEQPQTLNIFPSRPMHVVAEPSPKAATSTSNIVAASSNLKPQRPPSKQSAMTAPGGKATVKREGSGSGGAGTPSTSEHEGPRTPDAKTLRRLAQNREAARKSRLRKKAYIQNLETSRVRLSQMEQEMQRCSAQVYITEGTIITVRIHGFAVAWGWETTLVVKYIGTSEAAWFDGEYARWVDEHDRMMRHLRAAVDAEGVEHDAAATDGEQLLRQLIDATAAHHVVLAELKSAVARADVFHLVSGTWLPAAERCFIWIGGSRPSDLIKV